MHATIWMNLERHYAKLNKLVTKEKKKKIVVRLLWMLPMTQVKRLWMAPALPLH
jgi:hypothetical protein